MPITLNQFLLLVLTLAAVVAVTAFVIFLNQLKKTAREGEMTLNEIQTLAKSLNGVSLKIGTKLDDLGDVVESAKKTADHLTKITWFITTKIIRPSSRFWPLALPLFKMGLRQWKKKRRKTNGQ